MAVASFAVSAADFATPSFGTAMPYASQTSFPSGAVSDVRPSAFTLSRMRRTSVLLFAMLVPSMSSAAAREAPPVGMLEMLLQITLSARSAATSSLPYPSSASTSSVCSPSSGERVTSVGLSDILIGLPTERYLPRFG